MITTTQKILIKLAKHFSVVHTASSLSQELKLSRWGVWKIIKKLQQEELLLLTPVGNGKTSTQTIQLNWNNKLVEQTITLALAQESTSHKRWKFNFAEIEKEAEFLLLYGSIIHSPKAARDIDILIVAQKNKLSKINKIIFNIQKTQEKKIHSHSFTSKEFVQEIKKPNKIFSDALKRGTILFGQEKFVKFMKGLSK